MFFWGGALKSTTGVMTWACCRIWQVGAVLYVGAVEGLIGTTVGVKLDEPTPGAGTSPCNCRLSASLSHSLCSRRSTDSQIADSRNLNQGGR